MKILIMENVACIIHRKWIFMVVHSTNFLYTQIWGVIHVVTQTTLEYYKNFSYIFICAWPGSRFICSNISSHTTWQCHVWKEAILKPHMDENYFVETIGGNDVWINTGGEDILCHKKNIRFQ